MASLHAVVAGVTDDIRQRSTSLRAQYLGNIARGGGNEITRERLSCGNLAHGFAACDASDKDRIRLMDSANLGIVTAYNDMLSAHQPISPSALRSLPR